jgi:hypothetical protein
MCSMRMWGPACADSGWHAHAGSTTLGKLPHATAQGPQPGPTWPDTAPSTQINMLDPHRPTTPGA